MQKIKVTIVEMEHHFLYLPVYFARARSFFGHLPPNYETTIIQAQAGTDSDAYQRLARGEADMAICDPCAIIYAAQVGFVPQVIAGLVIRGAFWAVNTDSPAAVELDDLASFQHIIAFHPGTTSHGIAQRIVRSAKGIAPTIEAVRPLQELTKLADLVAENKSAVALSPDVLRIERSIASNNTQSPVKLALADTLEYAHLLVTAVIARPDFVKEHPEFIHGFLQGFQRSLIHASAEDPAVLAYAREGFNQPPAIVAAAIRRANNAQVWAPNGAITEDLWLNAVQAHYDSLGQKFDARAKRVAQDIFTQSFRPHMERINRSALELVVSNDRQDQLGSNWREIAVISISFLIGIAVWLSWDEYRVTHLGIALGIASLSVIYNRNEKKRLIQLNLVLLTLFAVLWLVWWRSLVTEEAYAGTTIVLVLAFLEGNFRLVRNAFHPE